MYRIKETILTSTLSQYSIQKRFCFIWFNISVDARYVCSLAEAQKWLRLKKKGYTPDKFYYE